MIKYMIGHLVGFIRGIMAAVLGFLALFGGLLLYMGLTDQDKFDKYVNSTSKYFRSTC